MIDAYQYKVYQWERWINMDTRIQHRYMRRRLKLVHSYQTYNIDICKMGMNLSTAMTIQMWIYARNYTKYSIATWGKQWTLNKYPGSSSCLLQSMILSMWLQCLDVEHGRNHLITDQWREPLTSAREITINVDDSQGTLVHDPECEWMIWHQTLTWIFR